MPCNRLKNEFVLPVNGRTYNLLALDECVLATLISFPTDEADITEMMWEQVNLYNNLSADEKEILRPALLEFYRKHKDEYSLTDSDCNGCDGCCR
jgi:hypothetical protein